MKASILEVVVKGLEINKSHLLVLINSLPENQKEAALEILLGSHIAMTTAIPSTKDCPVSTETKEFIGQLELTEIDALNHDIHYIEKYYNVPVRFYKTEEEACLTNTDYSSYKRDAYPVKRVWKEAKVESSANRVMSIEMWMKDNDNR